MERDYRRDDRRDDRRRRDDPRDTRQRPANDRRERTDRDRSRSPPQRDRRDDRRRERSPPRGHQARSGPPPHRSDRDSRDHQYHRRDRQASGTPPPPRGPRTDKKPAPDSRSNGVRNTENKDTRMQNSNFEDEDSEAEMARVMGFAGFRSTKDTKVPGNDKNYGVSKAKKSEYRQYMNRVGGFNRPLEAM